MRDQYEWIMEQIAAGRVVLAYDRRIPRGKVHHLRRADRVMYAAGAVMVDGKNATGWTFAVKP